MIQTNNYGFNIVEGTDVVNPLIQLNPNFSNLDVILKAIADSGVGTALQVKSGTNHAITKDDDCAIFKFVATADYRTGDTLTLNGNSVTLRCVDGTIPKDRAFVINQSVMCAINGTLLTLIGGTGIIDSNDVEYDNQTSGLTATNVQSAIDELKNEVDNVPIIENASEVHYDNTFSGLTATDVQSAIDEVKGIAESSSGESGAMTVTSTVGSVSNATYSKVGHTVTITVVLTLTQAISANMTLFTIALNTLFPTNGGIGQLLNISNGVVEPIHVTTSGLGVKSVMPSGDQSIPSGHTLIITATYIV